MSEEQALGAVGAFSGAPARGVCAWLLPFHKEIEAEGEGGFLHTALGTNSPCDPLSLLQRRDEGNESSLY